MMKLFQLRYNETYRVYARAMRFALDDNDIVANYAASTALLGRFLVTHFFYVPFRLI